MSARKMTKKEDAELQAEINARRSAELAVIEANRKARHIRPRRALVQTEDDIFFACLMAR